MRPFDVGDLVTIAPTAGSPPLQGGGLAGAHADCPVTAAAAGALRVLAIDVLTTTFCQADGRVLTWPNAALYAMTLTNLRRSGAFRGRGSLGGFLTFRGRQRTPPCSPSHAAAAPVAG